MWSGRQLRMARLMSTRVLSSPTEHPPCQLRYFIVGRESEANELIARQFANATAHQIGWQKALEADPLFETNDAILRAGGMFRRRTIPMSSAVSRSPPGPPPTHWRVSGSPDEIHHNEDHVDEQYRKREEMEQLESTEAVRGECRAFAQSAIMTPCRFDPGQPAAPSGRPGVCEHDISRSRSGNRPAAPILSNLRFSVARVSLSETSLSSVQARLPRRQSNASINMLTKSPGIPSVVGRLTVHHRR